MSYTDWRDWALGEESECPDNNEEIWRRVAENADCDARYEDPDTQPEAYRRELGDRFPTTKDQFNDVCRNSDHQLSGSAVQGEVPDHLARCLSRTSFQQQLDVRLETVARAGRDFSGTRQEDHKSDLPEILPEDWVRADTILPQPLNEALYLSHFESNRVFSTLVVDSSEDAGEEPTTFFEHLKDVQRHDWPVAKEAVYRLALETRPYSNQEYLLLTYESSPFDTHRYPVPPDAEFWPLFHPIERDETSPYGKTCPDGHPCDEERAEPELVHSNPPIAAERVQMRSLGRINPNVSDGSS